MTPALPGHIVLMVYVLSSALTLLIVASQYSFACA